MHNIYPKYESGAGNTLFHAVRLRVMDSMISPVIFVEAHSGGASAEPGATTMSESDSPVAKSNADLFFEQMVSALVGVSANATGFDVEGVKGSGLVGADQETQEDCQSQWQPVGLTWVIPPLSVMPFSTPVNTQLEPTPPGQDQLVDTFASQTNVLSTHALMGGCRIESSILTTGASESETELAPQNGGMSGLTECRSETELAPQNGGMSGHTESFTEEFPKWTTRFIDRNLPKNAVPIETDSDNPNGETHAQHYTRSVLDLPAVSGSKELFAFAADRQLSSPVQLIVEPPQEKSREASREVSIGLETGWARARTEVSSIAADQRTPGNDLPSISWREAVEAVAEHSSRQLAAKGVAEFEFRVCPPDLGPVQIRLSRQGDKVIADIVAATEAARHLIESRLAELRDRLAITGVIVDSLHVASGGTSSSESWNADNNRWTNDAPTPTTRSVFRGSTQKHSESTKSMGLVDIQA